MVSAPTEEDFKLDCFQDKPEIKSDSSCLKMDGKIEAQKLVSQELPPKDVVFPDGEILFFPTANHLMGKKCQQQNPWRRSPTNQRRKPTPLSSLRNVSPPCSKTPRRILVLCEIRYSCLLRHSLRGVDLLLGILPDVVSSRDPKSTPPP